MQRYESYKPSGIQWVEKIPSHWGTERAKWLFNRMERPVRPEDDVVTAFRDGQVTLRTNRRTEGFTNAIQEHGYQGIRKGDLVIHAMDAFAGAIGVSDSDGKSTPVYAACVPRGEYPVNSYYYAYLLRYMAHSGYIESLSKGIRERSTDFRFAEFRELPLPIPGKDEQDRIVAFLDQKIAEIDAAIAKKERLIELLSDQKKILVQRAVTRGLSDGVPMRNSGVSWIGEIPAHWSIKRVRAVFKNLDSRRIPLSGEQRGKMTSRQYDYYGASGAIDKVDDYLFDEPLILIAEDGANLVMRNLRLAFIATGKYWVNNHAHILKPLAGNMTYLCEALECVDYNPLITGAAQPKLTKDALKGVEIPFPPPEEQSAIASFVSAADMKYKEIESRFIGEISLLANLKQTTIANVVTGKIKV